MKLRYYLRGLGIGMLVAALVLTLSGSTKAKMSDEAVKRRAAELGMVEKDKSVLSDISGEAAEDGENTAVSGQEAVPGAETAKEPDVSEETAEGDRSGQAGNAAGDTVSADNTAGQAGNAADNTAETPGDAAALGKQETEQKAEEVKDRAEEIAENAPAGRMFTLEVYRGDSSISVARRAQEIGLIVSAADFDVFLCKNGFDKRISTGTYTIPENSSEKYIAEVITRSR